MTNERVIERFHQSKYLSRLILFLSRIFFVLSRISLVCPFWACCLYEFLTFAFALPFSQRFSIPLRAVNAVSLIGLTLRSLEVKANSLFGLRFSHKAYGFYFSNFFKFFNFPICVSCVNNSLLLCQLPDSATFWVLIDDRRLSSIVTALGRNRCLLRGSLSTFIG